MFKSNLIVVLMALTLHQTLRSEEKSNSTLKDKPQWQRRLSQEDEKRADKLNQQIEFMQAFGNYKECLKAVQELIDLRIRAQGEDHHETKTIKTYVERLQKLIALTPAQNKRFSEGLRALSEAQIFNNKNQFAKALEKEQLYLQVCLEIFGDKSADTANAFNNVAVTLDTLKELDKSNIYNEKSLKIYLEVFGEDHPETATALLNIANNLTGLGKYEEANKFNERSAQIYQKTLGESDKQTATCFNNIASNLLRIGKQLEAEKECRKALAIRTKIFGENHLLTANSLSLLGLILNSQGKPTEALIVLNKSLGIFVKLVGHQHPDTALAKISFAFALHSVGKSEDAIKLLEEAYKTTIYFFGDNHPNLAICLRNMGSILDDQEKCVEAKETYEKAIIVLKNIYQNEHPQIAMAHNDLAGCYVFLGDFASAEKEYRLALDLYKKTDGQKLNYATTLSNLTYILEQNRMYDNAELLHKESIQILIENAGADHPKTAASYNNYAIHLCRRNKLTEAKEYLLKALDIQRKALGEEHSVTSNTYSNLISLLRQEDSKDTENFIQQAIYSFESSRLTRASGLERSTNVTNPQNLLALRKIGDNPTEAWRLVEMTFARGLLDHQQMLNTSRSFDPNQAARDKLLSSISLLQSTIANLILNQQRTKQQEAELAKLFDERKVLERQLSLMLVASSQVSVATSDEIQASIPPDSALVFWVDITSKVSDYGEHWVCVVTKAGPPKWEKLLGTGPDGTWSQSDLTLVSQVRNTLSSKAPELSQIDAVVAKLRKQRIDPALKHLNNVKSVFVVPVNNMAGIPIELLLPDRKISYVPSGTYLARSAKAQKKFNSDQILALGDPFFKKTPKLNAKQSLLPQYGLYLLQIQPESTASKAGIMPGDVLLRVGETKIYSLDDLSKAISSGITDSTVEIEFWREDQESTFKRKFPIGPIGAIFSPVAPSTLITNRRLLSRINNHLETRGDDWSELPGSRAEILEIQKLFGKNSHLLADENASKSSLMALQASGELQKFRYLHFATHGEANTIKAFDSALILSQDGLPKLSSDIIPKPVSDGRLTAKEVLDSWRLNSDLVTLSACETAIGKSATGDGQLGFAQAFLAAGSRSVCLSLWKVDDLATMLLMTRFYQNLLGKAKDSTGPMGKTEALHSAKQWLKNLSAQEAMALSASMVQGDFRSFRGTRAKGVTIDKKDLSQFPKDDKPFSNPKYWSGFILIGDPN